MSAPTFLESIGNTGYIMFGPEATIGTPVTPADVGYLTDETMQTNYNLEDQTPIAGNYMDTFMVLPGFRSHGGDMTVIAEPITSTYFADMLLQRGAVTSSYTFTVTSANATVGATYTNNGVTFTVTATIAAATTLICTSSGAPLTSGTLTKASGTGDVTVTFSAATNTTNSWPFTLGNPTKSYTVDIPAGQGLVKRFWGVMLESIAPSVSKNQIMLKGTATGIGSFLGRMITSVTGSGPYTVTLDTTYTQTPTLGLVASDLIAFYDGSNPLVNATVATITNATQFTTSTNVSSFVSGDFVYLRQQTPTNYIPTPFLVTNTQYCFGATASAAIAATQTRVETASTWTYAWPFESKDGSQRTGNADPASVVRLTAQPTLTVKKFYGSPADILNWMNLTKTACAVRHYAYSGGVTYELRVVFPHIKTDSPVPSVGSKKVNYSNIKFHPQFDTTDGAPYITVVNNLPSIT